MSEYPSYHLLLDKTLKERGLNKSNIEELLLYYTHVIINTEGLVYSDGSLIRTKDMDIMIKSFMDKNPLTIDTILRFK